MRFSEKEKGIVSLFIGAKLGGNRMSLEETVNYVGFSGASGVNQALKRIYKKIREFCCSFPGLSP